MSKKPFFYQEPFPLFHDDTDYYLLSREHVSVACFEGEEMLKVDPKALTLLAQQAFHDASFMLRPAYQQQVAAILADDEASENDKYVALQFLRNTEIAAKGVLPTSQDTGTAIIMGNKRPARLDWRQRRGRTVAGGGLQHLYSGQSALLVERRPRYV
nr:Fumarate hydratase class I, aerobic [Candidatus Pantoea persica]